MYAGSDKYWYILPGEIKKLKFENKTFWCIKTYNGYWLDRKGDVKFSLMSYVAYWCSFDTYTEAEIIRDKYIKIKPWVKILMKVKKFIKLLLRIGSFFQS